MAALSADTKVIGTAITVLAVQGVAGAARNECVDACAHRCEIDAVTKERKFDTRQLKFGGEETKAERVNEFETAGLLIKGAIMQQLAPQVGVIRRAC